MIYDENDFRARVDENEEWNEEYKAKHDHIVADNVKCALLPFDAATGLCALQRIVGPLFFVLFQKSNTITKKGSLRQKKIILL